MVRMAVGVKHGSGHDKTTSDDSCLAAEAARVWQGRQVMASFATFAAAEVRAYAKRADGTWVDAHAARQIDGTLCVRVIRFMSATHPDYGAWTEITDDATA